MGGSHSTCSGEVQTGFWWEHLRERDHLKEAGINWMIILKWIFRKGRGMDWIDLAQNRDR
jgi:hypothetical protein